VMLPPGRAKLATWASSTGSANTIGIVGVSCCKATKPRWPLTRSTSGLSSTRFDAVARILSLSPASAAWRGCRGALGGTASGGNTNYIFAILHLSRGDLQRNRGTKRRLIRLRPTKEINPPVVQRRTWEVLADPGPFPRPSMADVMSNLRARLEGAE
jgi:hypothetical protein